MSERLAIWAYCLMPNHTFTSSSRLSASCRWDMVFECAVPSFRVCPEFPSFRDEFPRVSEFPSRVSLEGRLPTLDEEGNQIRYREWDVNAYQPGVNRGAGRLVTGSNGSAYYTDDHYTTFIRIR